MHGLIIIDGLNLLASFRTKVDSSTYLATAFDRIPILLSLGGIEECPAEVCTLSSAIT